MGWRIGYALAILLGVTVGFLMGWYPSLATILNPFISALYVVPVAALVPLLIVWFGIGATPRIITVMLFAVFEILLTTYTAVRDIDQRLVEMARVFGANQRQILTRVVIQATLPLVGAACELAQAALSRVWLSPNCCLPQQAWAGW
ncbi:MAG: ABC transporter permease subunit [Chloroflexaceae bacterium]|nr:ABC transporter permease subunit [Chloroflexaceae bacterium]